MTEFLSCVCGDKPWLPSSISLLFAGFDPLDPVGERGFSHEPAPAELKIGEGWYAGDPSVKEIAKVSLGTTQQAGSFLRGENFR
jgi:hypothetical protein